MITKTSILSLFLSLGIMTLGGLPVWADASDSNQTENPPAIPNNQGVVSVPTRNSEGLDVKLKKTVSQLGEVFNSGDESLVKRVWNQMNISRTARENSKSVLSQSINVDLGVSYKLTVQPAYVKDQQQRLDQYSANLSLSDGLAQYVGLGANFNAELTFSRLFESKEKALIATPYFPGRVPWTAEKVLNELLPGEVVRLDINAGASVGASDSVSSASSNLVLSAGAGIQRSSELLVDIYRMRDSLVRMRIVAIRHPIDANYSLGLDPLVIYDPGAYLTEKLFNRFFSIRPLGAGRSQTLRDGQPVNTYMVDYIFDLSNADAADAYRETMTNIYRIRTIEFLNLEKKSSLDSRIVDIIAKPEALVQRDLNLPVAQRAMHRIFKGTSNTSFHSYYFESRLRAIVPVWNKRVDVNNSVAQVRGYDQNDKALTLLYLTRISADQFQGPASYWETLEHNELNNLFVADQNESGFIPTALSDLVIVKNLDDKNLSQRQFLRAKTFAEITLPSLSDLLPQIDFSKASKVSNGYYKFRLVIHPEIIGKMKKISKSEIYTRLMELIQKDPFVHEITPMFAPNPTGSELGAQSGDPSLRLEADAEAIMQLFAVVLDDQSTVQEKYKAFAELREFELFQELGPALSLSLVDPSDIKDLVYMTFSVGGANLKVVSTQYGTHDSSQVLTSFQFMQSLINNRSFDLRLQFNDSGQFEALKDASKSCQTCDTLKTSGK